MKNLTNARPLAGTMSLRLGYMLRRASNAMMEDLGEVLKPLRLRPVEGTILILVGANPGCIQSDLGRHLGVARANMAPLVSGLVDRDLLLKSPVDGRSLALCLTAAGEAMRDRTEEIMDAHEACFARAISGEEEAALRSVLARIADAKECEALKSDAIP